MKLLLTFLLLAFCYTTSAQEKKLNKLKVDLGIPAIQVGYAKGDKLRYFSVGEKSLNTKDRIDSATVFQAASLSKVVFAYITMKLFDRGVIDIDKPLSEYLHYERLSEIPIALSITARHVLTHRSGLPNWHGSVGTTEWLSNKLVTHFDPGTAFRYSGEGFYYLQLVLQKLTGKSLNQLALEEVFVPFGMTNSSFDWLDRLEQNIAVGHKLDQTVLAVRKFPHPNAAYTLYTTAADYLKFAKLVILEGVGLRKETHQMMLAKMADSYNPDKPKKYDSNISVGLGIRIVEDANRIAFHHTGSNPGFRTYFIVYPDTKEIITLFTNSEKGSETLKYINQLFLGTKGPHHMIDWNMD